MTVEGFTYKEFAEDLANQAKDLFTGDISPEDQEYIYNTIKNYSFLAGEALFNDQEHSYTIEQASIIVQFIGEWSYHKTMDMIKGNIPSDYRDTVMQRIAYTIYEIAKQATLNNVTTDDMIGLVEHHVNKAYKAALDELTAHGIIDKEQAQFASSQSNLDDMAKAEQSNFDNASDLKVLKLVTFALIAKKLPDDKVTTILNKFNQSDANIVIQYMQMPDLEQKIDPELLTQCLKQFQSELPQKAETNIPRMMRAFGRNVKTVPKQYISQIVERERSSVKLLAENPIGYTKLGFAPNVLNIICKHIETKIDDYQKKSV